MKNKLVIFDLDGTLLNTIDDIKDALNKAITKLHKDEFTLNEVKHMVGSGVNILIERVVKKRDVSFDKMKELYMKYYGEGCKNKTKPYDGIINMLSTLKKENIKIAVLSNKPQRDTKATIDFYFPSTFDKVYGQREGVNIKPSPDAVFEIMNEFEVDNTSCLYVGDSDVDVMTALNSNLPFIVCLYGFRTKEELEKYSIDTFVNNANDLTKEILMYFSK